MEKDSYYLGIDIGSVSINTVLMDSEYSVTEEYYDRHKGEPLICLKDRTKNIFGKFRDIEISHMAFTGTGGREVSNLLGANFVNEIVAHSESVIKLYPHARTAIEMGGEDSKLILFSDDTNQNKTVLDDFSMNTMCAAGTGSFLDQQANRMGISIENEFGKMALISKKPPRIAGRCSVFAKSDMIHLQQIGTPVHDIVSGLCFALARSFKSSIGLGKKFIEPIIFMGGVSANIGLVRAFSEILELKPDELIIPKHYASMGAIGAILSSQKSGKTVKNYDKKVISKKLDNFVRFGQKRGSSLAPLLHSDNGAVTDTSIKDIIVKPKKLEVYVGVDIGSLSTNVVVIDKNKNVVARRYLRTAGRPIEVAQRGLLEIGKEIGNFVTVAGVGVTGSGRYMIGGFIGADVIKNEITAQATAALHFHPDVDTIFEIGGQDSKYISLKNGAVVDFEMNKVCAAGTGSFIEEQSEKLDISIEKEFGEYAFNSKTPGKFGNRCTVFIESDLVSHQQKGAVKEDLVAGLAYSIVNNYIERVVGDRQIGNKILFQGGVAWNSSVVAAFSKVTGKKINVPPHHDVTGAIGSAFLAMNYHKKRDTPSAFKGFDLRNRRYKVTTFECKACANVCNVSRVKFENDTPHIFGARCELFEKIKKTNKNTLPNLFEEREHMVFGDFKNSEKKSKKGLLIGIPRILHTHEYFPFWRAFFEELGIGLALSDWTNHKIIQTSNENLTAETCFPMKIIHGHCLELIEKGVTHIFFPALINIDGKWANSLRQNHTCPYVQTAPAVAQTSMHSDIIAANVKFLSPILKLRDGDKGILKEMILIGKQIGLSSSETKRGLEAAKKAQKKFKDTALKRGAEIFSAIDRGEIRGVAIISRSYNGCDRGLNMDLPKKLNNMGMVAIPLDFLPIDSIPYHGKYPNMYWKTGQRFLMAAEFLRTKKNLPAIHLSSFKCGPDSFITHFFKEEMGEIPVLELELDEHSADAGFITRCEAFFDSLEFKKIVNGE